MVHSPPRSPRTPPKGHVEKRRGHKSPTKYVRSGNYANFYILGDPSRQRVIGRAVKMSTTYPGHWVFQLTKGYKVGNQPRFVIAQRIAKLHKNSRFLSPNERFSRYH